MVDENPLPFFERQASHRRSVQSWMADRAVQVDDETRDRGGHERRLERRRQVACHPQRAEIVSKVRLQVSLAVRETRGDSACGTRLPPCSQVTTRQSVKSAAGSFYHCSAGNCLNTARVPSLHSLLSAVKYESPWSNRRRILTSRLSRS